MFWGHVFSFLFMCSSRTLPLYTYRERKKNFTPDVFMFHAFMYLISRKKENKKDIMWD